MAIFALQEVEHSSLPDTRKTAAGAGRYALFNGYAVRDSASATDYRWQFFGIVPLLKWEFSRSVSESGFSW